MAGSFAGITWIIIILIVVSILVTCSEVFLRFGILSSSKGKGDGDGAFLMPASRRGGGGGGGSLLSDL